MNTILQLLIGFAVSALMLMAPGSVRACAVCTGNPESPLTHGAQQGILVMLVVTYVVLFGLGAMFACVVVRVRLRRRDPSPPCLQGILTASTCSEGESGDHAELEYEPVQNL